MPNQHSSREDACKWIEKQRRWLMVNRRMFPHKETRRFLVESFADQCFPNDERYFAAATRRRLRLKERDAIPVVMLKYWLPKWFVKGFDAPRRKRVDRRRQIAVNKAKQMSPAKETTG